MNKPENSKEGEKGDSWFGSNSNFGRGIRIEKRIDSGLDKWKKVIMQIVRVLKWLRGLTANEVDR